MKIVRSIEKLPYALTIGNFMFTDTRLPRCPEKMSDAVLVLSNSSFTSFKRKMVEQDETNEYVI